MLRCGITKLHEGTVTEVLQHTLKPLANNWAPLPLSTQ